MTALFEAFIAENENHDKIEVIMVDKHISNLITFRNVFPDAQVHLCVFHVLQIFKREITPAKRNTTAAIKRQVIEILTNMIYCKTVDEYDRLYVEFSAIASVELQSYFDENWHQMEIRETWAGYNVRKFNHFNIRTNNRLESFNQKLKSIITHYTSLVSFFGTTLKLMKSMQTEKNVRTMNRQEKVPVKSGNEEQFVFEYRKLLTHFAFTHIKRQLDTVNAVAFSQSNPNSSFIRFPDGRTIVVTEDSCSCGFFTTMCLPCKHILKYRNNKGIDIFCQNLCHKRWIKQTSKCINTTSDECTKYARDNLFANSTAPKSVDPKSKISQDARHFTTNNG